LQNIVFLFDLDGTITKEETLPLIAKHFNIEKEINSLTKQMLKGKISFRDSFLKRVDILSSFSAYEISLILENVKLFSKLIDFIQTNSCVIVTGNLDIWIEKLLFKIKTNYYCSTSYIKNKRLQVKSILNKKDIVIKYRKKGYKVIFIGDSFNDLEAMKIADISIVSALIHTPPKELVDICDYVVFNEDELYNLLKSF